MPQVKKCIQRVTELLHDVRLYHNNTLFNINHVIINVINVLKKKFKAKIHIAHDLTYIKANTRSDRNHLELVLLYSLIEAVESIEGDLRMQIQLAQKERDAVVSINLEGFKFSAVVLKEITQFHDQAAFKMQIASVGGGTEMVIRMPLTFERKDNEEMIPEATTKVTINKPKKITTESPYTI